MFNFSEITPQYLEKLVDFLYTISWSFQVLNTQYVKSNVLQDNHSFLSLLSSVDLYELVTLRAPQNHHPLELQQLIENVNYFRINFDILNTESWKCNNQQKRMSVKKLYEIENMSKLIHEVCKDDVRTLVDLGSGLGYLDEYLHTSYGYKIIGLEGSEKNQERAVKRQEKYYAESIGKVKHLRHFITMDSGDFILEKVDEIDRDLSGQDFDRKPLARSLKTLDFEDKTLNSNLETNNGDCKTSDSNLKTSDLILKKTSNPSNIALFGLHPCGDLSIVSINLFLDIPRIKKLIISPCCYHKMSGTDPQYSSFKYYPLSRTVQNIQSKYPNNPFLRPFLRLAGQQSPIKFKEMTKAEHFVHGKNMFERAVVEALLMDDETSKRINNVTFKDGRLKFEDIRVKYQLLDKSTMEPKDWTARHEDKFEEIRKLHANGEEMSENLFCLQTTVQNSCENLVIMDRVFYVYEEMERRKLRLNVRIRKLQDEKLSPRCLVLIVEKN